MSRSFPPDWDQARVSRVIEHYSSQSEDEAVAEDEAALKLSNPNQGVAVMNTKGTQPTSEQTESQGEALPSSEEIAQRIADLERRSASHRAILNLLKIMLDQLKEFGSWTLAEAQRAELGRLLDEYDNHPDAGTEWTDVKKSILGHDKQAKDCTHG